MNDSQKIDSYIKKHSLWSDKLSNLRSIVNETELIEEVKWGAPAYTLNGKILIGMAAFKNHMGIWFHQGVFLKDVQKKLMNAQEKTKALRQWRFEKNDTIDSELVSAYVKESIENSLAGKEIKSERKKGVSIPPFLKNAFKSDPKLKEAFNKLSPGKQREYAEHIEQAKRATTKQTRLEKITYLILEGKGLHDKYKNC